jgi:hypothetical protein
MVFGITEAIHSFSFGKHSVSLLLFLECLKLLLAGNFGGAVV